MRIEKYQFSNLTKVEVEILVTTHLAITLQKDRTEQFSMWS